MTTAGPQRYPHYTVFGCNDRPIGRVHRDPVNPRRWVAVYPDGSRMPFVDQTSMHKAMAEVRSLADQGILG
jgi:hypothetical protein